MFCMSDISFTALYHSTITHTNILFHMSDISFTALYHSTSMLAHTNDIFSVPVSCFVRLTAKISVPQVSTATLYNGVNSQLCTCNTEGVNPTAFMHESLFAHRELILTRITFSL